nr:MAG TPA: hypothetical protein [Caudoviricetes sp.]
MKINILYLGITISCYKLLSNSYRYLFSVLFLNNLS